MFLFGCSCLVHSERVQNRRPRIIEGERESFVRIKGVHGNGLTIYIYIYIGGSEGLHGV